MSKNKAVFIFGTGGQARETAQFILDCSEAEILGFIDENDQNWGKIYDGYQVYSPEILDLSAEQKTIICAVGNPQDRRKIVTKYHALGHVFSGLIHHSVYKTDLVKIDVTSVIMPQCIVTVNVKINEHVHVNIGCTISHDVEIGSYSTISPGVHISGHVIVGENVTIGTGANIINGTPHTPISIGDNAIIGAGATVIRSISSNVIVGGVPAKPIK